MKLNIIYDSRRQEKWEPLMAELAGQGISDYEVWPCLILPNVVESISASHKMIVQDAKDKGLKECCIGEDDLMFTAPGAWDHFIKGKPPDYDLYLGGCYCGVGLYVDAIEKYEKPIVSRPVGLHLYFIHSCYYDAFLSTPSHLHIDTAQDGIYDICYPFVALQRPGFSANNMSYQNYNSIIRPEDIYKG